MTKLFRSFTPMHLFRINRWISTPGACALLCACLGFAWQALTVHYNYRGNWTGLFVTGSQFQPPPQIASRENLLLSSNRSGYDGQMYHYVAHDPILRLGFAEFMDDARVRYRRILMPALAFALALGDSGRIDGSIVLVNLLFLFAAGWWLSSYLISFGNSPTTALLFVLVPASVISLDRLTVDLAFTALCLGALYYSRMESRWRHYAILVLAALCRETGFVLIIAFSVSCLAQRKFREAALFSTAAAPAILWYQFVHANTIGHPVSFSQITPFVGLWQSFSHPFPYPFSQSVNAVIWVSDYLVLFAIVGAVALAFVNLRERLSGYIEIAAALWAVGALLLPQEFWADCCSSGRVLTPMLLFLALRVPNRNALVCALPLILVSLRSWIQVASSAWNIVKGIASGS